jgi:hypothetical protein
LRPLVCCRPQQLLDVINTLNLQESIWQEQEGHMMSQFHSCNASAVMRWDGTALCSGLT